MTIGKEHAITCSGEGSPEFVTIGYIRRAHGVRGEVLVTPLTDYPPRFKELKGVYIERDDLKCQQREIDSTRIRKDGIILKFEGVDDRKGAEELRGCYLVIPRQQCMPLPSDSYYAFDLIGMNVRTRDDRYLGKIKDIMELPAHDVYVVEDGDNELLIPAVKAIVKKVDLSTQTMIIEPIAGLLEPLE